MAGSDSLDLFERGRSRARGTGRGTPGTPLAERMRPASLDEVLGQDALLGPGAPLRVLCEVGELPSLLL